MNTTKKTNSAYYSRMREMIPQRFCAYCGKLMCPKYNEKSGRWESASAFKKRIVCDRVCGGKHTKQIQMARKQVELSENYRQCAGLSGLFVNRDGKFIYNGVEKKVKFPISKYGKKQTARLVFVKDGKQIYYSAARLVASAFKRNYSEDDYIEYKDGDIHNISVENLRLADKKDYMSAKAAYAGQFRKQGTYQYQITRLQNTIKEAQAVLEYFRTGKMEQVNRHVEEYLYECLMQFCVKNLHFSQQSAYENTADVIARMYEVLLAGHAISHMEYYCKELLLHKKKKGWYGHKGNVPKEISLIINNLNLDCLCKKYKVKKL